MWMELNRSLKKQKLTHFNVLVLLIQGKQCRRLKMYVDLYFMRLHIMYINGNGRNHDRAVGKMRKAIRNSKKTEKDGRKNENSWKKRKQLRKKMKTVNDKKQK